MELALLKKAAVHSVVLMLSVIFISCMTDLYPMLLERAVASVDSINSINMNREIITAESMLHKNYRALNTTALDYALDIPDASSDIQLSVIDAIKEEIEPGILEKLGNDFLMIAKPEGDNLKLKLENIYINKSIMLDITGMADSNISSDMILRIRGDEVFAGEPQYTESVSLEPDEEEQILKEVSIRDYGRDLSHGITVKTFEDAAAKLYSAQINITLDSVYEYFVYEDDNYFYIDLKKPSQVYDKIVVIDAGHGGKDGGAVSKDEKYCEKDISLDILLRLKNLLDKTDIKAYYTRTSDQTVYLRPRVELVNAVDADYFVSIHINANESVSPNGMEVLYYENEYKGVKSMDLADLFSRELEKTINLKQKGIVRRNYEDLYIMDNSLVPTVLLELGYISNKKDLEYLLQEENRQLIANAIFNSILRAYNELPVAD